MCFPAIISYHLILRLPPEYIFYHFMNIENIETHLNCLAARVAINSCDCQFVLLIGGEITWR